LSKDNRTVYAARDIKEGEAVLVIPRAILITIDDIQKLPLIQKINALEEKI
jgi:hypothetical protein